MATAEGRFEREITPVLGADGAMVARDEGLRDTTVESLGKLKPSFRSEEEGGRVTAGNSSQITDGASAVLIMSEEKAAELGLTPRARFVEFAVAGADPRLMLTAPIPATQKVLDRAGLAIGDIDLDRDQRGSSPPSCWRGSRRSRPRRTPSTSTAGRSPSVTRWAPQAPGCWPRWLCELERSGGRYGLQTMCEGGGLANATIIERSRR